MMVQADSLLQDSLITEKSPITFFNNDSIQLFTEGMPINPITNFEQVVPPPSNWFSITILFLFVYIVLVKILYAFNIKENIKGLWKIHSLDTIGFEKQIQYSGYILSPISAFVYAFYLYFYVNPYLLKINLDYLFLIFALAISALFIAKTLLEYLISIIFNSQKTFQLYFSDHLFLLGVSSFIQAPLLVIYIYSQKEVFLVFAITILSLLWIFRLFRGLIIGFKHTSFSKFYIFLYLCSLEILPLIIALKMVYN